MAAEPRLSITEDHLIGWLVFMENTYRDAEDVPACIPFVVVAELQARGWLTADGERTWDGRIPCGLTERGKAVFDINAPEWGVCTLEDAEA